jgi:hypothetical protein
MEELIKAEVIQIIERNRQYEEAFLPDYKKIADKVIELLKQHLLL